MAMDTHTLLKVIELPGSPLIKFDIAWVDGAARRFYVADRSNARVSMVDTDDEVYVGALGEGIFTGAAETGATSGPNGVAVLPDLNQLWAGDGDSTVKVFDLNTSALVASINTGGAKRVDELAYDSVDGLVLVANDKETPPFACLISTNPDHRIVGRIEFDRATNGLHQPVWDPEGGVFYLPVSEVGGDPAAGEIAVIDPRTRSVVASHSVRECQPSGLALGPNRSLCIGCSKNAIAAGFDPKSLIMDMRTGTVTHTLDQVGGSDEVWYNQGDGCYYVAASGMTGGPVIGVIDATKRDWVTNISSGPDSHSVAVDPKTNHVFVALAARSDLPRGGIGVYGQKKS
jgi:DNA-binding beta-propeller fold protein YncE